MEYNNNYPEEASSERIDGHIPGSPEVNHRGNGVRNTVLAVLAVGIIAGPSVEVGSGGQISQACEVSNASGELEDLEKYLENHKVSLEKIKGSKILFEPTFVKTEIESLNRELKNAMKAIREIRETGVRFHPQIIQEHEVMKMVNEIIEKLEKIKKYAETAEKVKEKGNWFKDKLKGIPILSDLVTKATNISDKIANAVLELEALRENLLLLIEEIKTLEDPELKDASNNFIVGCNMKTPTPHKRPADPHAKKPADFSRIPAKSTNLRRP